MPFKLWCLARSWHRCQVGTIRWRLYQVAGKVVRRARAVIVILKVQQWLWGLPDETRT
ncbi:MAG: hypothetical protein IH977_12665 [Nitrospinae bacterium]|nr:hypothetical protein [Nitrospinota bacterium]